MRLPLFPAVAKAVFAVFLFTLLALNSQAQSATLTAPANNITINAGDALTVSASTANGGGYTISNVVFSIIGSSTLTSPTDNSAPFSYTFASASTATLAPGSYTVRARATFTYIHGGSGYIDATASLTVAVSSPPNIAYSTPNTYTVGSAVSLTPSNSGGTATSYALTSGTLPSGLSFNTSTGAITGTPTVAMAATSYTVTATNSVGSGSSTFSITVYPPNPSVSASPGSVCGSGSSVLTASGGNPTGGKYNWYSASSGGTLLQSTTSATYTTPVITASTTYYVTYTSSNGVESPNRIPVTVTVNALPSATFSLSSGSVNIGSSVTVNYTGSNTAAWNFGGGTATLVSGNQYTVTWSIPGVYNISLTVTNANGCSATTTQSVTVSGTTLADYGFLKPIVLHSSQISNGGISSTLNNFPALVYIQDNALKTGNACGDKVQFPLGNGGGLTNGTNYDFAFTLPGSTTELYYQVDTYDSVNGILLAWVRIPAMTSTDVPLSFYFGSKNPQHSQSWSTGTWTSDYLAVYHFNEASTTATVLDATSNGRNAYQTNTSITNDEIHIAANVPIPGGGYSFGGPTVQTSIIQNAGTNPDITGAFTLSAWVYYNGTSTSDNKIVSNELNYNAGYKLSVKSGSLQTETRILNGSPVGDLGTGGAVSGGAWHYIQGVFTGGNTTGVFINYVDGVAATNMTYTYPDTRNPYPGHQLQMGIDYLNNTLSPTDPNRATNYYYGYMDEVRVSNVVKSADWIRAEYYNQTQPRQFCDYAEAVTSFQTNAAALTGAVTYTWTGLDATAPTDQTRANNWDAGYAPVFNGNTKLVIPATSSGNYPVLTADAAIYSLTLASGATINLNGHTLSVGCNIYNSATTGGTGILNGGNGANGGITWNGSLTTQYYYGYNNIVNTAEVNNMTVNNSAGGTVKLTYGPMDVYGQLTITSGNLVVDNGTGGTGATLTLKSSSTLTANVNAIPSAYSISGNVNVERYVSGGSNAYRGYRLFSSPVYTATSGSAHYYDLSYIANYMPTTGSLGTAGGMTKTGNPTIYLYRDNITSTNKTFNTGNFRGVCKINNSPLYLIGVDYDGMNFKLHPGTGFMAWYRGNLTNISNKFSTGTVAEANVFMSTGVLNQQAITVYNWYTDQPTLQYTPPATTGNAASYAGYNLVGNPYASSIDWSTFSSTNSAAAIYGPNVGPTIWEFNVINKGYGTYSNGVAVNTGNNIIASGQGFFVQTKNTGTASLTFTENAKSNTQLTGPTTSSGSSVLLLSTKPVAQQQIQYARFELSLDTINKEEAIVRFDNTAKNEYSIDEDAQYFVGSNTVKLSTRSADGVYLAINDIPLPKKAGQIVKMTTNAAADGLYTLKMTELKSIPAIYDIWLKDAYKNDSLDIKHNPVYQFNIMHSDTNSFGDNRFSLIIRQNPALGVHLLNFNASKATGGAEIEWKTENEANYTNFTVERSTDNGKTFTVVGGFLSSAEGNYSLMDNNPSTVEDQYRLKLEDLNGNITYSKIVTLMYSNLTNNKTTSNVFVYPNPATNVINVNITQGSVENGQSGSPSYTIQITGSTGKVLKTVNTSQSSWQDNVSGLLPGTYVIDVLNNNDKSVVGKAKFVKL